MLRLKLQCPMHAAHAVVKASDGLAFFFGRFFAAGGADAVASVAVPPLAAFGRLAAATAGKATRRGNWSLVLHGGRWCGVRCFLSFDAALLNHIQNLVKNFLFLFILPWVKRVSIYDRQQNRWTILGASAFRFESAFRSNDENTKTQRR